MLKAQVRVGGVYRVKVGQNITDVKLVGTSSTGRGWVGINQRTGRQIRIRSAAKLRTEVSAPIPVPDYKSRAAGEREG